MEQIEEKCSSRRALETSESGAVEDIENEECLAAKSRKEEEGFNSNQQNKT